MVIDNLFDIHYELESVQVDEINYAYILTLIQSMIQQEEDSPQASVTKISKQLITISRVWNAPIQN